MEADIAFLSLARNCASTLPAFLSMLSALRISGMRCVAYVGENGSWDGTNILLREAERRGELVHIPTTFMAEVPDRLHRMALGRQYLKNALAESGLRVRFVCVTDVDNVLRRPPPLEAIRNALKKLERQSVFAVSATSRPWYYDLLAYEDDSVSFEFLLDDIEAHKRNLFKYRRFFYNTIYPYRRKFTSHRDLLCTSAFNGMCIYQGETYALGSYMDSHFRRCEHLTFNRQVAKATGVKMLIDPELVLLTPSDHGEEAFIPFVWRRLKKRFGRRG
jgi:hypothetical protein